MSTFSTPGGLYERAQKRFGLQDGKKLFCYSFFDRQRLDVQPFFADIYDEALRARAAPGHRAIAAIHAAGKLLRHYTLNIDGLAAVVGMDTWHPDNNPDGVLSLCSHTSCSSHCVYVLPRHHGRDAWQHSTAGVPLMRRSV